MLGYEHSLLLVDWHRCTTVVKRAYNISGDSSGNISVSVVCTHVFKMHLATVLSLQCGTGLNTGIILFFKLTAWAVTSGRQKERKSKLNAAHHSGSKMKQTRFQVSQTLGSRINVSVQRALASVGVLVQQVNGFRFHWFRRRFHRVTILRRSVAANDRRK